MEFDPHRTISKLAEVTLKCPDESLQADISDAEALASGRKQIVGYHLSNCRCGGTGRIVPFASLRVPCGHSPLDHEVNFDAALCKDWQPEPDVEKACWRVGKILNALPAGVFYWIGVAFLRATEKGVWDAEEGWLRAAEAWLDEQATKEAQP